MRRSCGFLTERWHGSIHRVHDDRMPDTDLANRHPQLAFTMRSMLFGTPTDRTVRVERGERLPGAPRGFGWHLVEQAPDDDTAL